MCTLSFSLTLSYNTLQIPIALDILNRPDVSSLVDEFFFEFHFRLVLGQGWYIMYTSSV